MRFVYAHGVFLRITSGLGELHQRKAGQCCQYEVKVLHTAECSVKPATCSVDCLLVV